MDLIQILVETVNSPVALLPGDMSIRNSAGLAECILEKAWESMGSRTKVLLVEMLIIAFLSYDDIS